MLEGDHAGQAGPAFQKPVVVKPGTLAVLHVPCDGTPENLLRDLPQQQVQADSPEVPSVLLPMLLVVGLTSKKVQMLKVQELNFEKCFPMT